MKDIRCIMEWLHICFNFWPVINQNISIFLWATSINMSCGYRAFCSVNNEYMQKLCPFWRCI